MPLSDNLAQYTPRGRFPSRVTALPCGVILLCLAATGCTRAPSVSEQPGQTAAAPIDTTAVAPERTPLAPAPHLPAAQPRPAVAAGTASAQPPPGQLRDISFDDLKLQMQKGDLYSAERLTPAVRALEKGRVRIRGYILPSFQQKGITQFVLVRDNMECCFGPGALLHDCVVVRMQPGKSADFSIRPVAVSGTFRVEELRGPDGKHLAIYALDGDQVQ